MDSDGGWHSALRQVPAAAVVEVYAPTATSKIRRVEALFRAFFGSSYLRIFDVTVGACSATVNAPKKWW
jgi:hypothetical protein